MSRESDHPIHPISVRGNSTGVGFSEHNHSLQTPRDPTPGPIPSKGQGPERKENERGISGGMWSVWGEVCG